VAARKQIEAGVIGTPVVLTSTSRDPFRPPLEFCDPKVSGGLIADMGIHDFDVARMYMGDVKSVYAVGCTLALPRDDIGGRYRQRHHHMVFESGALGAVHLSRNVGFRVRHSRRDRGTKGSAADWLSPADTDPGDDQGRHYARRGAYFMERFESAYLAQIQDFVNKVQHGGNPA